MGEGAVMATKDGGAAMDRRARLTPEVLDAVAEKVQWARYLGRGQDAQAANAERYELDKARDLILATLGEARGGTWQPIETAPKDGKPFIAANRMDAFRAFYDLDGEVWTAEDSGKWFSQLQYPPTHWAPLPPKGEL